MKFGVRKMCTMAILAALSLVLVLLVHFPIIPAAPWLEYDPADIPILIGGFVYGPIAGLLITVVASLIQAMTVSAASGWVGFVMHVISTGTLVLVSSIIYKFNKTRKGAFIALVAGSIAMTAIMIPANLFFTVRYWGQPYEVVKASIIPIIIPFNLIKSTGNSLIVFLIYKTLRKIIK
ncbi:MAG TPA: ECF transporter S component [Clostridiaceae bacterium]|jgi:riboflavin transporter FmnP|nr:ECF transporter S component [Clostridiaceae bacterium]